MVIYSGRKLAALLFTQALLLASALHGAVPEYKLGDIATEDVITPVPLTVIDSEATQTLQEKEAKKVRLVVRYMPGTKAQVEADLRDAVAEARTNFLAQLSKAFKGRALRPSDVDLPAFKKTLRAVAAESPKDLPLGRLAPLWVTGESDEPFIRAMLKPLLEVMARPVIAATPEQPIHETIRLVTVSNLDVAPAIENAERGGLVTNGWKTIALPRARQVVLTNFPPDQRGPGRFAASFLRTNANPDFALTAQLRARRTENLAVKVEFQPAQIVVRKGQTIDPLSLSALSALREKSLIGTLQTKLEVEQSKAASQEVIARRIDRQTQWIAIGFGIVVLTLGGVLWGLRARRLASLLPATTAQLGQGGEPKALPEGADQWRDRALSAEARAERAQQAVRSGVLGWMRNKIVHGLFRQRSDLLSAQQRAEAEMRALEKRLEQLHAPLQERIAAYEKRIAELERDLAVKGEQNIELIKAKISLARHRLEVERSREGRFGTN